MIFSGIFWKLVFSLNNNIPNWDKFIIFFLLCYFRFSLRKSFETSLSKKKKNPLWASNQSQFQSAWLPKRPRKNNLSSLFMLACVTADSSRYLCYRSDWKDRFGNNIFPHVWTWKNGLWFVAIDLIWWTLYCFRWKRRSS